MNDELRHKIEQYLSGTMTSEEADAFSGQIEADPDLYSEVQLSAEINFHLSENLSDTAIPDNDYTRRLKEFFRSAEAKQLEAKLRKVQQEYRADQAPKSKRPNFYRYAAILTILIGATFAIMLLQGPNSADLYASYYTTKDVPSVITRGDASTLKEAAAAFQNEEYQKALELFQDYYEEEDSINPSAYIYSGLVKLELGQGEEAISDFDSLINSTALDRSKGLWFKALAYLKMDKVKDAKKVLESITESESNFNYSKAVELLEEL